MDKITWYIDSEKTNDYYAGSNIKSLTILGSVWNNRKGDTTVKDIENPTLICKYRTLEDASLIEYTNIEILNRNNVSISKNKDFLVAKIQRPLAGTINDGRESIINDNNFIKFRLHIDIEDCTIKEDDLKELYLSMK